VKEREREWGAVAPESTPTGKKMGRDVLQSPDLDKDRRGVLIHKAETIPDKYSTQR